MRKLTLLLLFFTIYSFGQNNTTTYYLIRHAEKERSEHHIKNPHLTKSGKQRAENWSELFDSVDFDAIYSTNYHRTIETATPTSLKKSINIRFYDPFELYSESFKEATRHKTVLIVGHSNTTPAFVNRILKKDKYSDIDDRVNGNLYILTIHGATISCQLLHLNGSIITK